MRLAPLHAPRRAPALPRGDDAGDGAPLEGHLLGPLRAFHGAHRRGVSVKGHRRLFSSTFGTQSFGLLVLLTNYFSHFESQVFEHV